MFFLKIVDGSPVDHPLLGDNVKEVLNVSILTDAYLAEGGYEPWEDRHPPLDMAATGAPEYRKDEETGAWYTYYPAREFTQAEKVSQHIRGPRTVLLLECDWTQSSDSPLSDEKKAEWATYRQALRDMTSEQADIDSAGDVEWPAKPE